MNTTTKPQPSDLPTSKQLIRSTLVALGLAATLLVIVVLPAEYAIDPTGLGKSLGLTEMGEIKAQLAEAAAVDAGLDAAAKQAPAINAKETNASDGSEWRDSVEVHLRPGQGAEVKLTMLAGEAAQFSWIVQGGGVNYDMHGDGGADGESISYEKGRDALANEGIITAKFDGHHGWFWRNRGNADVTIKVQARGQYSEMKRVM